MFASDHIGSLEHRAFENLLFGQLSSVVASYYGPRCSITAFLSVSHINITMFSTRMAIGGLKTLQLVPVLSQMNLIPLKSASLSYAFCVPSSYHSP